MFDAISGRKIIIYLMISGHHWERMPAKPGHPRCPGLDRQWPIVAWSNNRGHVPHKSILHFPQIFKAQDFASKMITDELVANTEVINLQQLFPQSKLGTSTVSEQGFLFFSGLAWCQICSFK